jgi:hypothetical protein
MNKNINKKISRLIVLVAALGCGMLFSQVKLDVKTSFKEKSGLKSIKWGVIYFLEKNGYRVVEVGEDAAVWLENFQENREGSAGYKAKLTVKITPPSLFRQKTAIASGVAEVKYRRVPGKLNVDDKAFLAAFKDKYGDAEEKEIVRAFHVGRAAARETMLLLLSLKRRKTGKLSLL